MQIEVASRTDVGRVRINNEDSLLAEATTGLFVVCDGMGGHAAGEVASQLACDVIRTELAAAQEPRQHYSDTRSFADLEQLKRVLEIAVARASGEIYRRAHSSPDLQGMGTTCTAVLLADESKGILAHVGDSRLYLVRGGAVHQLSEDHTYVGELVARGALTSQQATTHPQSNVLSRALGVQPSTPVDCMIFDLDPGDTLLLSSDGLHNYYPDEAALLPALVSESLDAALGTLIDGALKGGGHDNCTGILIRIGEGLAPICSLRADERIAILRRLPIFGRLNYNEAVKLLGLMQVTTVAIGDSLFNQGDPADTLIVLLRGELDVVKDGAALLTLKPGGHLGERAMIDNAPRAATARARTDAEVLTLSRRSFESVLKGDPVVATKLLWSLLEGLGATKSMLEGSADEAGREPAAAAAAEVYVDDDP